MTETLLPVLRPLDWPHVGLVPCRALLPSPEPIPLSPWVTLALDSPTARDTVTWADIRRMGRQPEELEALAVANLERRAQIFETQAHRPDGSPMIVLCTDEYAAEAILSPARMLELQRTLRAKALAVAIPKRGMLLARDAWEGGIEQVALLRDLAARMFEPGGDQRITPLVLLVQDGRPIGNVKLAEDAAGAREAMSTARVRAALRAAADGAEVPDLRVTHYATSVHRTHTITITGRGEVLAGEIGRGPQTVVRKVTPSEVKTLARALYDADLPSIRLPAGTPMPPPTVPPSRIDVSLGDDRIAAELPASELRRVPVYQSLVTAIDTLATGGSSQPSGDPVFDPAAHERLLATTHAATLEALRRAAAGQSPESLDIQVTFHTSTDDWSRLWVLFDIATFRLDTRAGTTTKKKLSASPQALAALASAVLEGIAVFRTATGASVAHPRIALSVNAGTGVELTVELPASRLDELPALGTIMARAGDILGSGA